MWILTLIHDWSYIDWQVNWKVWHLPWHCVTEREYNRDVGTLFAHFAGFGPFQFHWWSTTQ